MRFFAPQGRHVAPMGVKFGMEEVNFTPIVDELETTTAFVEFLVVFLVVSRESEESYPAAPDDVGRLGLTTILRLEALGSVRLSNCRITFS